MNASRFNSLRPYLARERSQLWLDSGCMHSVLRGLLYWRLCQTNFVHVCIDRSL
jgi:hypothetical protein